jgi:uncharacterized cupin superfamily protein
MTDKTILKFGAVDHAEGGDLPKLDRGRRQPDHADRCAAHHRRRQGDFGHWRASPGTYHATYTDYEFVHMIAGRIIITPDGGAPVEVGPGDAFVVEANFKGTWKIIEPVTKHFVVRVA